MADSISIVLITCNRDESLKKCLESVACQSDKPDEIIIVDNGSRDKTGNAVSFYRDRLPVCYTYIPRVSIPEARNLAIKQSGEDVLIMIDDDCVLEPDHVRKVKECYAQNPDIDYLAYKIDYLDSSTLLNKVFVLSLQSFFKRKYFPDDLPIRRGYLSMGYSTIASVRRNVLQRLPYVFDNNFLVSEDIELSIRLKKAGCRVYFDPDIVVYHDCVFSSFFAFIKRYFFYARGEVALKRRHGHSEVTPKVKDYFNFIISIFKSGRLNPAEKILISAIYSIRSVSYLCGYLFWRLFSS